MAKPQNNFSTEAFYEAGRALAEIGRALEGYRQLGVYITGFSVKGPSVQGDEVLVVLRGIDEDGTPVVAFHSAYTTIDAVRGASARIDNGTLKWREDKFKTGGG